MTNTSRTSVLVGSIFFLLSALFGSLCFAKTVPCLEPTTKKDPDVTWKEQGFEVKEIPCYQLTREGLEKQVLQKKEVESLREREKTLLSLLQVQKDIQTAWIAKESVWKEREAYYKELLLRTEKLVPKSKPAPRVWEQPWFWGMIGLLTGVAITTTIVLTVR